MYALSLDLFSSSPKWLACSCIDRRLLANRINNPQGIIGSLFNACIACNCSYSQHFKFRRVQGNEQSYCIVNARIHVEDDFTSYLQAFLKAPVVKSKHKNQ